MQTQLWNLRYAARQLRNSPSFTLTVVLTLALGIGATTAIFSAVYGLLLKSLPFADADRIVAIAETHPQVVGGVEATYQDYEDWRTQQRSFSAVAAFSTLNPNTVSMTGISAGARAEQVHRVLASGNFFSLLGVSPLLGRTLEPRDDAPGSDHVAVLSSAAWDRYFHRDSAALGRNINLNGTSFTVVGILPPGAAYPAEGEVWLPLALLDQPTRASRVWHSVQVLGRLRPSTDLATARADMQTIAERLAAAYPATNRNERIRLLPLRDQLVGTLRPAVLSLLGAVLLVLLIACANVASLLLVRATANRREVAVRQALGADRKRLFSQFLAQTVLLCFLGGALGIGLAAAALPLLCAAFAHTAGLDPSMLQSISLSLPVLFFTLGICSVTAILFGLLPVLRTSNKLTETLRGGDRSSTAGSTRARGLLIAAEIATAVILLFLGTLVMRSYQQLLAVDPGFRTDHVLSAEITLPSPRYTDQSPETGRFFQRLVDKLSHAPGVLSVAATTQTPLKPSQVMTRFLIEGAPPLSPGAFPFAQIRFVSPNFFQTMGLTVRDGRVFEQRDIDENTSAFVVNDTFSRLYLGGQPPLGRNVLLGVMFPNPAKIPVIGVVSDAHDLGIGSETQPELYLPGYGTHEVLLLRSAQDPESLITMLRNTVREIDPDQPIYNVEPLDNVRTDSLTRQRMTAVLLGIFACVQLALAAIGIYGVLSYSIAQRTREIGVRMALGASRIAILQLVLVQAGIAVAVGVAAGLAGAFASARLMRGLLFQTGTADPSAILITLTGLALAAVLALTLPAARAASVDPAIALRAE